MKIIKDLVHGYVEIDQFLENIINTLSFQRLKDIRQLTAQHVFPSATHNRFEHSLGVMYLCREAFLQLEPILENKFHCSPEKYQNLLFNLTIAALLHDVGHAPYSHLGEKYYRKDEIKNYITNIIKRKTINISPSIFSTGSNHELMSCYIILEKYHSLIISQHGADIELICRCIIGKAYNTQTKWIEDIVIGLLNSKTIDMDKLDYLLRDAYMTGVSVPPIDIARLFKYIYINPRTKKISFLSQALPVIQNIIDSRDSLYLWIYNHHTVVYSDFVIEFYIKHMILNYENNNKYADKLDPNEFFSCNAIANGLVSDSDLFTKLKCSLNIDPENLSRYTHQICPQLFERKFLKPLWKTIFEYKEFLETHVGDSSLIEELEAKMCDNDYAYRRYVAVELIKKCDLNLGQTFIVPRSNKFYSLDPNSIFHIYFQERDIQISKLLPQKDFRELYHNIAFYVFGAEEKIDKIRECFVDIVKEKLPYKDDLDRKESTPQWFSYAAY